MVILGFVGTHSLPNSPLLSVDLVYLKKMANIHAILLLKLPQIHTHLLEYYIMSSSVSSYNVLKNTYSGEVEVATNGVKASNMALSNSCCNALAWAIWSSSVVTTAKANFLAT